MSAAIEIDGRIVELNEVSDDVRQAIKCCDEQDYRQAVRHLCDEITSLSAEIEEMRDELHGEAPTTLTAEERDAIGWCIFQNDTPQRIVVTLRPLLSRLS